MINFVIDKNNFITNIKGEKDDEMKDLIIPEGIIGIGNDNCESVFREFDFKGILYLSKTLKIIGANAFHQSMFCEVDIPDENTLEIIEPDAFLNSSITRFPFEKAKKLKYIGSGSFANSKLKNIDLSHNDLNIIKKLSFYALKRNGKNVTLKLPDSIQIIEESAFCNSNIIIDKMPRNLKICRAFSFFGNHIKKIDLSLSQIEAIGDNAFAYNDIDEIILNPYLTDLSPSAFEHNNTDEMKNMSIFF